LIRCRLCWRCALGSYQAKVATDDADGGSCASKDIYYHGVKIHISARKQYQSLPLPEILTLTKASEHDLPVLQRFESNTVGNLFADKAYQDQSTEQAWAEQGVIICTPDKTNVQRTQKSMKLEKVDDGRGLCHQ